VLIALNEIKGRYPDGRHQLQLEYFWISALTPIFFPANLAIIEQKYFVPK